MLRSQWKDAIIDGKIDATQVAVQEEIETDLSRKVTTTNIMYVNSAFLCSIVSPKDRIISNYNVNINSLKFSREFILY